MQQEWIGGIVRRWAAYAVLLVTGLSMVWVGDLNLTTFWIATSLGLFVLSATIAFFGFTPTLRRQIAVLATEGSGSPAFAQLSRRATLLGISTMVPVVVIVFPMVTNRPSRHRVSLAPEDSLHVNRPPQEVLRDRSTKPEQNEGGRRFAEAFK